MAEVFNVGVHIWLSPVPVKKVPMKMGSTEGTLVRHQTKMNTAAAFHQPRVPTFHY